MTESTSPHDTPRLIRVRSTSVVKSVAGAIAAVLRESGAVEVHAIGVGAINQAVKALATARIYLQDTDQTDLICTPYFLDLTTEKQERTGIRLVVELQR